MKLKVRELDLESGKNTVLLSDEDCRQLGVFPHDRVKIYYKDKSVTAIVNTSNSMINRGEIGIFTGTCEILGVKSYDSIQIEQTLKPESLEFIKKKMQGLKLSKEEIYKIIDDIVKENISDIELSAYVTSLFINELNIEETDYLTRAMVDTGETLDFPYPVVDVHSIGGVPGNKYALITVPIVAALGLKIPKTSSRAISSAAGTADVMEVLAKVDLRLEEIRKIVDTVGATLAWGG
ncbi:MAG: thymidine phosphorylase, partial [Thermoplasmata archaeon]